jgi:hypothetical protein
LSDTGVIRYVDIDLLDMSEFNQWSNIVK